MGDVQNNKTGAMGADGFDDVTGEKVAIVVTPGAGIVDSDRPTMASSGNPGKVNYQTGNPGATNPTYVGPSYSTVNAQKDEILAFLATATREQVKERGKMLNAAGFNNTGKEASIVTAYHKAVQQSSYVLDGGGQPAMTPGEFIMWKISNGGGGAGNKVASGPKGPDLSPTSSVQLTGEMDAKAIVNNALNNYLGRAASTKEIDNFHAMLNKAEKASPTVTTHQGLHATTTTGSDVNSQEVAKEFAQSRGDYAETQASTTLMDWLQKSIMKTDSERII